MYLQIDENPNCEFVPSRVWQERSAPKLVSHVLRSRQGQEVWCEVTGLEEEGRLCPAVARKVDDSGEGTCYLVTGGAWGLRLKDPDCGHPWLLDDDPHQWGESFLLLPADGEDLRFCSSRP